MKSTELQSAGLATPARDNFAAGFLALTSLMVLSLGSLAFSAVVLNSSYAYFDSVNRRESRIQAQLYANSCLDYVSLMAAKDYFLNGKVELPQFDCTSIVENNFAGSFTIQVRSTFGGVNAHATGSVSVN